MKERPVDPMSRRAPLTPVALDERSRPSAYDTAEHAGNDLLKLHVASARLAEARSRDALLDAIEEVIVSVIGCEVFALIAAEAPGAPLAVLRWWGLDAETHLQRAVASAAVQKTLRTGEPFIGRAAEAVDVEAGSMPDFPAACAAIWYAPGHIQGVLVLSELLPHKPGLEPVDKLLLSLLTTDGGRLLAAVSAAEGS